MSKKGRVPSAKAEQAEASSSPWQEWLRYELYGILLILISIVALAEQGTIGQLIAGAGHLLLGKWYSLLGIYGIYAGIVIMFRRGWPFLFSVRHAGAIVFILGLLITSHIQLFHELYPVAEYRGLEVIAQSWTLIWDGLWLDGEQSLNVTQLDGGGMIGAILYAILYVLVDDLGAMLFSYSFFAIGLLLFTGLSYVRIIQFFRDKGQSLVGRIRERSSELRTMMAASETATLPEQKTATSAAANTSRTSSGKNNARTVETAGEDADSEPPWSPIPAKSSAKTAMVTSHELHNEVSEPKIIDFQAVRDVTVVEQMKLPIEQKPKVDPETGEILEEELEPVGDVALNGMSSPVKPVKPYELPSVNLMKMPPAAANGDSDEIRNMARKLELTMESFGVRAKVLEVHRGPAVTRFEIQPDVGVKVSRIVSLNDDIALALAAKDVRIEAPIPGKSAIGIEVPNSEVAIVSMREMIETKAFQDGASPLTIAFGRDISGQPIVANLVKMPHLLVAGATGSGKSVCINGIISSVLYKAKPDQVRFLMIDPKMVELNMYNGIPHLLAPVVTDPRRASLALKKVVVEMEKRYELFSKNGVRNIDGYNAQLAASGQHVPMMPYIVVIVDELADLMMVAAGDVEDSICRLAQMARAAGIHLIIATQRPSVDVITGVIKANIPSRIAFGVSSQIDSRTILDMAGAEKLLGRGDMLFLPMGASKPVRVQGAFISDLEVESIVHFVRDQDKQPEPEQQVEFEVPEVSDESDGPADDVDELFDQAVQIVVEAKQASVSLLQRRMRIGYARAARLVDQMEAKGIVGPYEGSKPREVLPQARWKGAN